MVRWPSLGLAEITWRWSFAGAAGLLFAFSILEYLDTLPITSAELFLLRTRRPALISQAILRMVRGSAPRAVVTTIIVALAMAVGWIVIASLGRAATVRALLEYFRAGGTVNQPTPARLHPSNGWEGNWRLGSLIGLNFFRVGITLAAAVGFVGALILARGAMGNNASPGWAVLIAFILVTVVGLLWWVLNWILSLSAIFVISDGEDTFGAVTAALDLWWARGGALVAAASWFSLAHLGAFIAASCLAMFPLFAAGALPRGVVLGCVLLVSLLYFAVADFLYVGRLASYIAIVELPEAPAAPLPLQPPPLGRTQDSAPLPKAGVDPEELILSDVPGAIS